MKIDLKNWKKKYSTERMILVALGASMECNRCAEVKHITDFGMYSSYCKPCRAIRAEYKAGAAHLPISPEQRIYKAKERLGPVANKNQSLVLAKSAQIAIEEINQSYEKHPKLTARALQRLRATSKRPKARQSGQGT